MTVTVVTDSTASLPAGAGIEVVALTVLIDEVSHREGAGGLAAADLTAALRAGAAVSTSQPAPADLERAYRAALAAGASHVVSVHLSAELSGTVAAAEIAARDLPVTVVDSRTVAGGLGRAALAAATVARLGGDAVAVAATARSVAAGSRTWFAVDTLEYLRAGGRLGPTASVLGTVLGVRPVLSVVDGALVATDKVRGSRRARERVVDHALADAAARVAPVAVVQHLANEEAALAAADRLRDAGVAEVEIWEVSAVLGAHTGPGVLAVTVSGG